ncbi:MAG: extracellular solute-binding protein [Firmicutes bacterium]|jgi:raffinose/stachyose/melibiose transport system substrate-binding protein|nr:extracellular solute-binding protein [Bacillota bacterium]
MIIARRTLVILTVIACLGLLLTPAAMAEKVNLTFWSWRTEDVDAYNKFIKEFNSKHPDINVEFVAYRNTEYNTILATALQAGSGPDIIHLRAYGGMEPLAKAGYLMPLDGKVPELESFSRDVLLGAINRADGRVYGVPFAVQTVQVLYNKAIFRELGLEEPSTWDEFLQLAAKVKEAGYIPFANGGKEGWTLETYFGAVAPTFYGGSTFFDDVTSGEAAFTDIRFKAAIEKMLELRPYLPDQYMGVGYTDMQMMFAQEMGAMFLAGIYELGTLAQMNPDLEVGVFVVPAETAEQPKYITMYVDGSYGINAATQHPEAALEFIRFLATEEYGTMFTNTLQQISAVPGVEPENEILAEVVALMEESASPYLMLTAFRYGQPSGSTLLQNELQGVFAGEITVDEALANIQAGLETWYEPFMK